MNRPREGDEETKMNAKHLHSLIVMENFLDVEIERLEDEHQWESKKLVYLQALDCKPSHLHELTLNLQRSQSLISMYKCLLQDTFQERMVFVDAIQRQQHDRRTTQPRPESQCTSHSGASSPPCQNTLRYNHHNHHCPLKSASRLKCEISSKGRTLIKRRQKSHRAWGHRAYFPVTRAKSPVLHHKLNTCSKFSAPGRGRRLVNLKAKTVRQMQRMRGTRHSLIGSWQQNNTPQASASSSSASLQQHIPVSIEEGQLTGIESDSPAEFQLLRGEEALLSHTNPCGWFDLHTEGELELLNATTRL